MKKKILKGKLIRSLEDLIDTQLELQDTLRKVIDLQLLVNNLYFERDILRNRASTIKDNTKGLS